MDRLRPGSDFSSDCKVCFGAPEAVDEAAARLPPVPRVHRRAGDEHVLHVRDLVPRADGGVFRLLGGVVGDAVGAFEGRAVPVKACSKTKHRISAAFRLVSRRRPDEELN